MPYRQSCDLIRFITVTVYANLNRLFTVVSYFPVAIVVWANTVTAENAVSFSPMLGTLLDVMFWEVLCSFPILWQVFKSTNGLHFDCLKRVEKENWLYYTQETCIGKWRKSSLTVKIYFALNFSEHLAPWWQTLITINETRLKHRKEKQNKWIRFELYQRSQSFQFCEEVKFLSCAVYRSSI